jgi:aspartyl protease family protein
MRYYLLTALAVTVLFLLLFSQFPGALQDTGDQAHALQLAIIAIVVGAGYLFSHRHTAFQKLHYLLGWAVIFIVFLSLYSFREQFSAMGIRLTQDLYPSGVYEGEGGALVLTQTSNGHFYADINVNGSMIRFMVDTGASDITLSQEDAKRVGLTPEGLRYVRSYNTANGTVQGAPVVLDRMELGGLVFNDVPASVNRGAMDGSLLGMRFLQMFHSFTVEGDKMVLVP